MSMVRVSLNLNGFKFLVFNKEVLALREFVPPRHVLSGDQFAGFGIDILLFSIDCRSSD
jgi:hypothetical protein